MNYKIITDWDYSYLNDIENLKREIKDCEVEIENEKDQIESIQNFLTGDYARLGALCKRLLELNQK
jgi:hypothetical protein